MEPGVITVGLDPADGVAADQSGDSSKFDRDDIVAWHLRRGCGVGGTACEHPAQCLVKTFRADRFEQIVQCADLEGRDGLVFVRGHENQGRRVGELRKHPGQFQT